MTQLDERRFYLPAHDLWIVTCYFNPCGYINRKKNFLSFLADLERSQLNYLAVECAFNEEGFQLPLSNNILRVRSNSVLWQKERLLNIAIKNLPNHCQKVAWLDGDLAFASPDWAIETSELLEEHSVVQLFEKSVLLASNSHISQDELSYQKGFVSIINSIPNGLDGLTHLEHGHTGFGWAARKEIVDECGLYDRCIVGGGDHVMAHAAAGNWHTECLKTYLRFNQTQLVDFELWANKFHKTSAANLAYVSGTVLHKWHGSLSNRFYTKRNQELSKFSFNPTKDISVNSDGCWEWNSNKPEMHAFVKNYFQLRQEDEES